MPPSTTPVVLVVEDFDDQREMLVSALHRAGYLAVGVTDGEEALQALRGGLKPDLILLDLMTPVVTGWAFRHEQLNNPEWAAIPTAVVTGAVGPALDGVVATLAKPYTYDEVFEIVRKHAGEVTRR